MARRKKYGDLNLMGTTDLGQVQGIHPAIGAAVSVGTGTATAIAVRQFSGLDKHSELIGGGVGVGTGVIMMLFPASRAAGFTGVIAALLNNGLRYAAGMLADKEKLRDVVGESASLNEKAGATIKAQLITAENALKAAKASPAAGVTSGALGIVRPQVVPTLGAMSAERVPTLGAISAERRQLAGGGLGMMQAEQRTLAASQLPTFQNHMGMGQPQNPVQIVGSNGIGRNFGATIFGSR
jgi:hypothetical protein